MTRPSPVAITGAAVITPLGDSPAALAQALLDGQSKIAPMTNFPGVWASRLEDFDATRYANVRGMRVYNRASRMGISATRLALVDAGLENAGLSGDELGIVTASSFGHLDTLIEYDRSLVGQGPSRTNPALMPLAIPSAPGAVIALSFAAKAFSITLASGGASSLDALGLGARLVSDGRARACVVVSAFSLADEFVLSAARASVLAPLDGFRPFDIASRGTVFGEAAAAVVLESMETAQSRGRQARGLVRGQSSRFAPTRNLLPSALVRAATGALGNAGITPEELALVSTGANGVPEDDRALAAGLGDIVGKSATPVAALKSMLGETVECAGLLQMIVALEFFSAGRAAGIARLATPVLPGLAYLTQSSALSGPHALVTASSRTGAVSALVVSAHD
jgi:3-oxoacyl-(acyl-carrier-protein) synthase